MTPSLFVVFHSALHEHQYEGVENHFTFAKVGNQPISIQSSVIRNRVMRCDSLSGYRSMGSNWAESEFLFSLYSTMKKEPNFYTNKWIGFLQYDHTILSEKENGSSLVSKVESLYINNEDESSVISFVPIDIGFELHYNCVAMDFSDFQKQRGNPLCYFPMISLYNKFYGTNSKYDDLLMYKTLPLCSSFAMSTNNFMEMMRFCDWVTQQVDLNMFDPARKNRQAGGLMERFYATWITMRGLNVKNFQLDGMPRL